MYQPHQPPANLPVEPISDAVAQSCAEGANSDAIAVFRELLDTQEVICRSIATRRDAMVLRVWHEPFSGRKDSRPTIDEMIAYVKAQPNGVDYLIFRDIDRLTRAGSPSYRNIKTTFASLG